MGLILILWDGLSVHCFWSLMSKILGLHEIVFSFNGQWSIPSRPTRSSSNNSVILYRPRRCKTATYQRSFFIRASRTWNSLPKHLRRLEHLSLTLFKKSLLECYHNTLVSCYDVDDAQTWKTVCLKWNTSHNLIDADRCCYYIN